MPSGMGGEPVAACISNLGSQPVRKEPVIHADRGAIKRISADAAPLILVKAPARMLWRMRSSVAAEIAPSRSPGAHRTHAASNGPERTAPYRSASSSSSSSSSSWPVVSAAALAATATAMVTEASASSASSSSSSSSCFSWDGFLKRRPARPTAPLAQAGGAMSGRPHRRVFASGTTRKSQSRPLSLRSCSLAA